MALHIQMLIFNLTETNVTKTKESSVTLSQYRPINNGFTETFSDANVALFSSFSCRNFKIYFVFKSCQL